MGKTVTLTLAVEDAKKLRAILDAALEPAPIVVQRLSTRDIEHVFEALSSGGVEFFAVFEKIDGSERAINARVVGPVQYNYSKHEKYVNVIDLDIEKAVKDLKIDVSADRKIVISRVKSLTVDNFEFVSSGR